MSDTTYTYVSIVACLILTGVIVGSSYGKGSTFIEWAYNIGDQPIYRFLFLLLILLSVRYSFSFGLLLALLFMMINSLVPMLTNLDETFVFGSPVTDCGVYNKKSVKEVGTPFYPLNNVGYKDFISNPVSHHQ